MRFFTYISALLAVCAAANAAAAGPQRIVSIGLCTDQLLLLIAEREQIASLSNWAVNADMSYLAGEV
ncbi:MAG TPA: ABC transporter substrate-binding protein, partial [Gammaproteobacteria bacterium]